LLLRQRASPRVAQPPADRRGRIEVGDEQRLLEAGRAGQHFALVVQHHRMAVEDQLVLATDGIDERDEARRVPRPEREHLLTLAVLADMERRRRDVDEQLRAGQRQVGRGRPRLPHVLADRHAHQRVAEPQQDEVVAGCEVPLLVEDAVVGQEAFPVHRLHLALGTDRARVVEVAGEVGDADERCDPRRFGGDLP
jgi:hypothetical protein